MAQATAKASHFAKHACETDAVDIVPGNKDESQSLSLAKGEDITQNLFQSCDPAVPDKPPSKIAFQRAALVSFQTWAIRSPGSIGLLVGHQDKNRDACHSVVVFNSTNELLHDQKVKRLYESHGFRFYGIALIGRLETTEDNVLGHSGLSDLKKLGCEDATTCAFVAETMINKLYNICQYMQKCTYIHTYMTSYGHVFEEVSGWVRKRKKQDHVYTMQLPGTP